MYLSFVAVRILKGVDVHVRTYVAFFLYESSLMVPMRPSWTCPTIVNVNQKHVSDVYEPSLFLWDLLVFSHWFTGQVMRHVIQSKISGGFGSSLSQTRGFAAT